MIWCFDLEMFVWDIEDCCGDPEQRHHDYEIDYEQWKEERKMGLHA